jgi:hypothetical protein
MFIMICTVIVLLQPGYGVLCEIFLTVNMADDACPEHGPPRTCNGWVFMLQCVVNKRWMALLAKQSPETLILAAGEGCWQFLLSSSNEIL